MKTCKCCNEEKELSTFGKNKGFKDGLNHWCKPCAKSRRQSYVAIRKDKDLDSYKLFKSANMRKYRSNPDNKAKLLARNSLSRVARVSSKPKWYDDSVVTLIYSACKTKSLRTGIKHHVDHIVPLVNSMVCGLHVQDNLQIITAHENMIKSNKWT